jgi:hypothetical protein
VKTNIKTNIKTKKKEIAGEKENKSNKDFKTLSKKEIEEILNK